MIYLIAGNILAYYNFQLDTIALNFEDEKKTCQMESNKELINNLVTRKEQMLMEFSCLYKSIKIYNMKGNGGFFNILQ